MSYKYFSLAEARTLLPKLQETLAQSHSELSAKQLALQTANSTYIDCELAVDRADSHGDIEEVQSSRESLQSAIAHLHQAQESYMERFNFWVAEISNMGVILRDIHAGLLDFPCREGGMRTEGKRGFAYFLCWRMDEADINYWHLADDGFSGRKPLSALKEHV